MNCFVIYFAKVYFRFAFLRANITAVNKCETEVHLGNDLSGKVVPFGYWMMTKYTYSEKAQPVHYLSRPPPGTTARTACRGNADQGIVAPPLEGWQGGGSRRPIPPPEGGAGQAG